MKKIHLNTSERAHSIGFLENELSEIAENELVLILIDTSIDENKDVSSMKNEFAKLKTDILFASSGTFGHPAEGFNLFYWKYYPRDHKPYPFLYPKIFIGYPDKLRALLSAIKELYNLTSSSALLTQDHIDVFQRYYVEYSNGAFSADFKISLDTDQRFFGVSKGRESRVKWPFFNHRHSELFHHYEQPHCTQQTLLKKWDLKRKKGKYINTKTGSIPFFVEQTTSGNERSIVSSFLAYLRSWRSLIILFKNNFGKKPDYKIFRYSRNLGGEMNASITKITDLLASKTPFAFSHFNDGELTFIKKYKEENHGEVWFGRRQNKYNKALGSRLISALQYKKLNYFVGIPCEICHPSLNEIALNTREKDEHTLPAMTLHHNLSYMPKIIHSLRKRKLYFVCNSAQDLSFFKQMGLEVDEASVIHIPFKNSHLEYDVLKDQTFEKDSVVLMMCGMLAKILTPHWFENNPGSSFITFGSALDDHIQNKINFNLYPKELPFSKHIIGTRFFLFGNKKKCPSCFDLAPKRTLKS